MSEKNCENCGKGKWKDIVQESECDNKLTVAVFCVQSAIAHDDPSIPIS
jgi:hypothetical protein